jgi:Ala-tRNA(Pro) deacylase
MPVRALREFLDKNNVKYVSISHSPAYTAQEIAASAHIPGDELVLPSSCQVDFDELAGALGVERVELVDEYEFRDRFGECEVGAMPPFGNLYGMDVYVAEELTGDEQIAFNAGTHTELIQMAYSVFERLVQPKVLSFAAATW